MATFILLSGAWHGAWWWQRVVPLLESNTHRVLAPDLLGMGSDPTPAHAVSVGLWTVQIADLILSQSDPVILVGHSRAGLIISEVAERLPDRIRRLVYLAAYLLPSGTTLLQASQRVPPWGGKTLVGTGDGVTTRLIPSRIAQRFYNLTPPEWVDVAIANVGPEPMPVFDTPLALTDARYGSVPRAYIECTQDRAVPLELQRLMLADLPCDPVITMDSDHSPAFSQPEALAAHLEALAATAP